MLEETIAKSAIVRFIIECIRNALDSISAQTEFNKLLLAELVNQRKKVEELESIIKRDPKLATMLEQQRRLSVESKKVAN